MPSKTVKKQKPLQLDCSALINHLSVVQNSISNLPPLYQQQCRSRQKPNLQMLNFNRASLPKTASAYEWYLLVASTKFSVSAQLVPVPKSRDSVVVPDLIQCTPISIWTCSENNELQYENNANNNGQEQNTIHDDDDKYEILNCDPIILIQDEGSKNITHDLSNNYELESKRSANYGRKSDPLMVSVVLGTRRSRVLCVQLSIFSYVGVAGRAEGRYVLSKATDSNDQAHGMRGIVEPLPLDSDESIRKQLGETTGNNNGNYSLSNNNDGQSSTSGTDVTSGSRDASRKLQKRTKWVPFHPKGGVTSFSPLYHCRNNKIAVNESAKPSSNGDFIWITYDDATLVRLPRWAFFPIVDDQYDDVDNDLGNRVQIGAGLKDKLVKAMVLINSGTDKSQDARDLKVMPLPKCYPSLMSQPLSTLGISSVKFQGIHNLEREDDDDGSGFSSSGLSMATPATGNYEFFEAITFGQSKVGYDNSCTAPTLSFYSNEDHFFSKIHSNVEDEPNELSTVQSLMIGGSTLIGGTAAIAKGVFEGVLGAVIGRTQQTEEETMKGMEIIGKDNEANVSSLSPSKIFPSMHEEYQKLPLSAALFDSPRQIINGSVDPVDGMLIALSDNLGRVQLVDLSTRQVIRLWKGFRNSTCHWIQFPFDFETGPQIIKYLAIHCRERKIVEIYRMRYGPRVGKYSLSSDAQIVQCVVALNNGDESYTKCFVLQTNNNTKRLIAKELMIHDDELNEIVVEYRSNSSKLPKAANEKYLANHESLSEGTIQLQLLKQLLASESAVPADVDAVYDTLSQICGISDLSRALDLLAVANRLEDMGICDSTFHAEVISHSQEKLKMALSDEIIATSNNPLLDELHDKIKFHQRLVKSFDILHQFESSNSQCSGNYVEKFTIDSKSQWIVEAIAWLETAKKVVGSIDGSICSSGSKITFSCWSRGCLQDYQDTSMYQRSEDGHPLIYLCDSTRDRKNILGHIFRPLLKDIFTLKTIKTIFEEMGIQKDNEVLLQYYGEWFMSLSKAILEQHFLGIYSPPVRWLHDIAQQSVSIIVEKKENSDELLLNPLYKFCISSSDLPRAFFLASVAHEAIIATTKNLEDKTYGEVTAEYCVKPWEQLLRKLRVCLLISLRLRGKPIAAPICVSNVEQGLFSIYEWIARDLLSFSHKQHDISNLEIALVNAKSFHPSLEQGDDISRWKMIQEFCLAGSSLESSPKTLLFFLSQFNCRRKLAAHRALLLAQQWGTEPESVHILNDSFEALQDLGKNEDSYSSLLAATLLEIWQSHIRPFYRALLFGFEEAHEISEDVVAPLFDIPTWFPSINKISMKMLKLMISTTDREPYDEQDETPNEESEGCWPSVQEDIVIQSLIQKSFNLDESSVETHHGIICAVELNDNLSVLPMCVESFDSLFLRDSLATPFARSFKINKHQQLFIEAAIKRQGELAEGPTISRYYVDDLVTLGRIWGLDKGHILTQFLLVMYELARDDFVDDMFNSVTRLLDVEMFLDHGIPIVCVRLNTALSILKKAKQCRNVLALLDADTCEFVKEQARACINEIPDIVVKNDDGTLVSLENTHALILRMKRMSAANRIDAYALSVMCETLLKAMDYIE